MAYMFRCHIRILTAVGLQHPSSSWVAALASALRPSSSFGPTLGHNITTSSAEHHAHLTLGVTKCFKRSVQDDTSTIRVANLGGSGADAILGAITAAASQPTVFSAFNSISQPVTGQNVEIPKGVNSADVFGLEKLVESGKYKLPIEVIVSWEGV